MSPRNMNKIRLIFFQLAIIAAACGAALADDGEKTHIGGYADVVYLNNAGIGWTGSEATFTSRIKLDVTHRLYDDALVRMSGEWQPTASPYSRAYGALKHPEARPDDIYLEFSRLFENTALRLGSVKVPFGRFDTLALNPESMPMSFVRTREWDFGCRMDARFQWFDLSLAIVNGEGTIGTDTNSDKSLAVRLVFPAQTGDIYPETLEITNFPNPSLVNPDGAFGWQLGVSGYNGTKYSTPIKQKGNHYGVDLKINYSVFSFLAQYSYLEGGFTDPSMNNISPADLAALMNSLQYSDQVAALVANKDVFPKAYAVVTELVAGLSDKTVVSAMGEFYKPDADSDATPQQKLRQRLVLGVKYDFRKAVSGGIFYVKNYNPAFGMTGNVIETDSWKGEDVITCGMAMEF